MVKRIIKLPFYFSILIILLLTATLLSLCCTKFNAFLILNGFHDKWLDVFFKTITHLGDGLFSVMIVLALFLRRKKKKALTILFSFVLSGCIVQILKRIFHMPRPKTVIEQVSYHYPNFVEGVNLAGSNSFPSGHTTSAFALATAMAMVYKKKKISGYLILFAFSVGYSRIYLAQHFLQDAIFGALTGILCAMISYYQIYDLKLLRSLKAIKRRKRWNAMLKQGIVPLKYQK